MIRLQPESRMDLHIHSTCSDGTMTPEEICRRACLRGVEVIAICDHNCIEALDTLEKAAPAHGLYWIKGVELDCVFENRVYHLLGYDFDPSYLGFRHLVEDNRRKLDGMSIELIQKMEDNWPSISLREFLSYQNDPSRGGWPALNYFLDQGIAKDFDGVMQLYGRYGCSYLKAGFAPMEEVCSVIHDAGGKAVLAHPGYSIKGDQGQYKAAILRMLRCGVDGIECDYPLHTWWQTEEARRICKEHDLLITGGSDCHGDFQKTYAGGILEIGVNGTLWKDAYLGEILVKGGPSEESGY